MIKKSRIPVAILAWVLVFTFLSFVGIVFFPVLGVMWFIWPPAPIQMANMTAGKLLRGSTIAEAFE
jgi:hypothetical protein